MRVNLPLPPTYFKQRTGRAIRAADGRNPMVTIGGEMTGSAGLNTLSGKSNLS
jgi:hypothetical protein